MPELKVATVTVSGAVIKGMGTYLTDLSHSNPIFESYINQLKRNPCQPQSSQKITVKTEIRFCNSE